MLWRDEYGMYSCRTWEDFRVCWTYVVLRGKFVKMGKWKRVRGDCRRCEVERISQGGATSIMRGAGFKEY